MNVPPRSYRMAHPVPLYPAPSRLALLARAAGELAVLLLVLASWTALVYLLAQP